eukprot:TRINITY_DN33759_c0_g1_i1.p1 TRINITY_DN33759_c0_g1~~TRINITY_DN33759_c0_g1_i1.p1  ORF type:complete len:147 (-),score=7.38 TRINITY_DN33759_c0_g1_i1:411-851(-)
MGGIVGEASFIALQTAVVVIPPNTTSSLERCCSLSHRCAVYTTPAADEWLQGPTRTLLAAQCTSGAVVLLTHELCAADPMSTRLCCCACCAERDPSLMTDKEASEASACKLARYTPAARSSRCSRAEPCVPTTTRKGNSKTCRAGP